MVAVTGPDASTDSASPSRRGEFDAQFDALDVARRRQERAFIPSTNMEGLVLQVIGGWEQFKAAVNMYRLLDAGPGTDELVREKLPAAMNKLARRHRIRWPHSRFSTAVNHASDVRHQFAHFFYVSSILGDESPDRTLYFTRLGKAGAESVNLNEAPLRGIY